MEADSLNPSVVVAIAFAVAIGGGCEAAEESQTGAVGRDSGAHEAGPDAFEDADGPFWCELLADGTCLQHGEREPDDAPSVGCCASTGYRYDVARDCLIGPDPVNFACTPGCAGFGEPTCYIKPTEAGPEVYWITWVNMDVWPELEDCGALADQVFDAGFHGKWCSDVPDAGASDAGPFWCELLADGTCLQHGEREPDDSPCDGCHASTGYRYDVARDCLIGPDPVNFACTPECAGFGEPACYLKPTGDEPEVYLITWLTYGAWEQMEGCGAPLAGKVLDAGLDGKWCSDMADARASNGSPEDAGPFW